MVEGEGDCVDGGDGVDDGIVAAADDDDDDDGGGVGEEAIAVRFCLIV